MMVADLILKRNCQRLAIHTFLAIMVPVGTCSTFLTLPPLPCPNSFNSFRSSFRKSNLISAFISKLASVFDSVAWYVFLRMAGEAVIGAEPGPLVTERGLSCSTADTALLPGAILGAFKVIGGGRLLPPAAGACRIGTGSGSGATGSVTANCNALKLRFLRMGVAIGGGAEDVTLGSITLDILRGLERTKIQESAVKLAVRSNQVCR